MGLIVFPSDITAEQGRLKAGLDALNTTVVNCAKMPADVLSAWQLFYNDASNFAQKTAVLFPWPWETNYVLATANTGDTVLAYENELDAWNKKIAALTTQLGCSNASPAFNPLQPSTLGGDTIVSALKFVAIAAVAVGGAYVVKEGISFARDVVGPSRALPEGER